MGDGIGAPGSSATVPTSGAKPPSEAPGVRSASLAGARAQDFWRVRMCHLPTESSLPRRGSADAHVPPAHRAPSFQKPLEDESRLLWLLHPSTQFSAPSQNQGNDFVCRPAPSFFPRRQDARAILSADRLQASFRGAKMLVPRRQIHRCHLY